MANEPDNTPIQTAYARQFAADLEKNRKEQEDINTRIAELQARLEQLKADEQWLSGMQVSLPPQAADASGAVEPARPDPSGAAPTPAKTKKAAVPQPRRGETAGKAPRGRKAAQPKPATTKAAAAKTTAKPATKKTAAKKAAAAKQAAVTKAAGKKSGQLPLRELVEGILSDHAGEPLMVREVRAELDKTHSDRAASAQVVRNTLEALAKKGSIEKGNQQGSVMYTKPTPGSAARKAAADRAARKEAEKVPALA